MGSQSEIRVRVNSDPRLLSALRGLVRGYLAQFGFDADRVSEAVLAVDEACSNAIRHAYRGRKDRWIELTLDSGNGYATVTVRDSGIPAKRGAVARRRLRAPRSTGIRPGGLGVQLMYEVFDTVAFATRCGRGNRVEMRLRLPKQAAKAGLRSRAGRKG